MSPSLHRALASRVFGTVTAPTDPSWRDATQPWNLLVDQRNVAAVVEPASVADVRAVVRFAAEHELIVVPQRTGHGAVGIPEGSILLRTRSLDVLRAEPDTGRLLAGAGVLWGSAQGAAAAHGLTGTPGSSPGVGVTGYTVGGGLGWFSRAHGLGSASVYAFNVVTADGELRRVDASHEPDLFWALRGGGGDHAIVTSVELNLHRAPNVFGGRMTWAADRAHDVMSAYATVTADAPKELTIWVDQLHYPGSPTPIVAMSCAFLGDESHARSLLRPFDAIQGSLSDQRRVMQADELGAITNDPIEPSAGKGRSLPLGTLAHEAIDVLLEHPVAPLLTVQLRHLGGALTEDSDTPNGALHDQHLVYLFGALADDRPADLISDRLTEVSGQLTPFAGHGRPLTLIAGDETIEDALPPESVKRLRTLKERWDPNGTIRSNHPVAASRHIEEKR